MAGRGPVKADSGSSNGEGSSEGEDQVAGAGLGPGGTKGWVSGPLSPYSARLWGPGDLRQPFRAWGTDQDRVPRKGLEGRAGEGRAYPTALPSPWPSTGTSSARTRVPGTHCEHETFRAQRWRRLLCGDSDDSGEHRGPPGNTGSPEDLPAESVGTPHPERPSWEVKHGSFFLSSQN